jgi:HK97 family phage major capsid protein
MGETIMAEMTEDLVKQVALDAVNAFVKESGMDKIDQKFLVVPEVDEKEHLKKTRDEKVAAMLKAIVAKDYVKISQIKAADPNNVTTDADGGYLMPDETQAEILQVIPTYAQARQFVNVGRFPLTRDNITIPKESTGMTVYYPGEQGSITSSKLALTYITLAAKKAAGIAVLTNELRDFGAVDFVAYIKNMAARAFGQDEDAKVFGVGNTTFTGLFYGSNAYGKTSSVASATGITYSDLLAVPYGLDQNYITGAQWFMHRTMVEQVRLLKDDIKRPIFVESNASGLPTLLGYPVRMIEAAPTATGAVSGNAVILFGNLNNSMLKDKLDMRVDLSTDAVVDSTSLFQSDLSALRFVRHWTFHPGLVEKYGAVKLS